jgi:hypothetical protein
MNTFVMVSHHVDENEVFFDNASLKSNRVYQKIAHIAVQIYKREGKNVPNFLIQNFSRTSLIIFTAHRYSNKTFGVLHRLLFIIIFFLQQIATIHFRARIVTR